MGHYYADDDIFITRLLLKKIDKTISQQWLLSLEEGDYSPPNIDSLLGYLEKATTSLLGLSTSGARPKTTISKKAAAVVTKTPSLSDGKSAEKRCTFCKGFHFISRCFKYLNLPVESREKMITDNKLCKNCLSSQHSQETCTLKNCPLCNGRHHRSICRKNAAPTKTTKVNICAARDRTNKNLSLLPTALVFVVNSCGQRFPARAMVDSGCQTTLITSDLASRLGTQTYSSEVTLTPLGQQDIKAEGFINLKLTSHFNTLKEYKLEALILPNLVGPLPSVHIPEYIRKLYKDVNLADPSYYKPGGIDIILGVNFFAQIIQLQTTNITGPLACVDTLLGCLLMGDAHVQAQAAQANSLVITDNGKEIIDRTQEILINSFWDLDMSNSNEGIIQKDPAVIHFEKSYRRDENGLFILSLPFKKEHPNLGHSRHLALNKFLALERRFRNNPELKKSYVDYMREYIELGHMELIEEDKLSLSPTQSCYVNHHAVFKANDKNKIRVVINCSSPTSNRVSLNDVLERGPALQNNLRVILTQFRLHPVAFTSDLVKFYRSIELDKKSKLFFKLFWRENENQPLQVFVLSRVTFGCVSSPFMALYAIKKLIQLDGAKYSLKTRQILDKNIYVDDVLVSFETIQEATDVIKELETLLGGGGFTLSKYASNSAKLLDNLDVIPPEKKLITCDASMENGHTVALGMHWIPQEDVFKYNFYKPQFNITTKRQLLSEIARFYDPLGYILPLTMKLKIMFQSVWKMKLDWDDKLPRRVIEEWQTFCEGLPALENFSIQRFASHHDKKHFGLLGCADASMQAYVACVYLLSYNKDKEIISSQLLAASGRVAPLKTVSLPRLELCALVLLTQLVNLVKQALPITPENVYCLSDSTVALSWIKLPPSHWNVFVANRVAEIQTALPEATWGHIPGTLNPADLATRGLSVSEFLSSPQWFRGPPVEEFIPIEDITPSTESTEEGKYQTCTITTKEISFFTRFRSWTLVLRVVAKMRRWLPVARRKLQGNYRTGPLVPKDLQEAEIVCLRLAQQEDYSAELEILRKKGNLPKNSALKPLCPFIEEKTNLLRVGGRLQNGPYPYDLKHPIILPYHNPLTALYIKHLHFENSHGGTKQIIAHLRERFFVSRARNIVRRLINTCLICARFAAKPYSQIMAPLPTARVTPSRPFTATGVDYAGPFTLCEAIGRRQRTHKGYVALFICMSTKAVHVELVSSLTTECFLAALNRFMSRRGNPKIIYSDQGTTFKGAKRELSTAAAQLKQLEEASMDQLVNKGIHWNFIPPYNPHAGGLWERAIQSMKFHLKRVAGNTVFSFEEFNTLLIQCEAVLNSRPLTAVSDSPDCYQILTPFNFLIGSSTTSNYYQDLSDISINRLSRWQRILSYRNSIWTLWRKEYLVDLQKRAKWNSLEPNVKVGQLVFLLDPHTPPLSYKLGRIKEIFPGKDGKARHVRIATPTGEVERHIVRIAPIPNTENCPMDKPASTHVTR